MELYQLVVDRLMWEEGPRLRILLKFFPRVVNNTDKFNTSELQYLNDQIATFAFPLNDTFGPYDFLNFILLGPYENGMFFPYSPLNKIKTITFVEGMFQ